MRLRQSSATSSERSRMTKGIDSRRRDAATARPEGPAPTMMGPGVCETLVEVVVAIEDE